VVWDQRDPFSGEDDPPVPFDWPWPATKATAVDALGQPQPAEVVGGRVQLRVSPTPLFVTPTDRPRPPVAGYWGAWIFR
jgi:hypothetical protein